MKEKGIDATAVIVFSDRMKVLIAALLIPLLLSHPVSAGLRCVEANSVIEVYHDTNLVLRYNKVPTKDAAGNDPAYTRTGYIHPLCTPSGKVITGDYAPDHPHQHGLFFAWTKTSFEGRAPEFWNQKQGSGRVSYVKTLAIISEANECGFDAEHLFEDLTEEGGPKAVMKEVWQVRVSVVNGRYQVDLTSKQQCAANSPLTIEKYHYGGMAIRGNSEWLGEESDRIVTSEGRDRVAGNHTRPAWVKMTGRLDGAACGVVAIPHPGNFRAPQWVRLHPSKPYFVFSPMVEEAFTIKPGEEYESKFRFLVFDGEMEEGEIRQIAGEFPGAGD